MGSKPGELMSKLQHEVDVGRRFADSMAVTQRLKDDQAYISTVREVGLTIAAALRKGSKVFFVGNGGSAADAQHLAAELTGRYLRERASLPAIALTADTSVLTAISNDYGYDMVFARQLQGLAAAGDVLVGLTTSGNSPNILRAIDVAKSKGLVTVGMTGGSGGKLRELVDFCLCVPSSAPPRIQEAHILTGHVLCEIIEDAMFGEPTNGRLN
jgi:D-sedoheptulose 7-phosphate isomerase